MKQVKWLIAPALCAAVLIPAGVSAQTFHFGEGESSLAGGSQAKPARHAAPRKHTATHHRAASAASDARP